MGGWMCPESYGRPFRDGGVSRRAMLFARAAASGAPFHSGPWLRSAQRAGRPRERRTRRSSRASDIDFVSIPRRGGGAFLPPGTVGFAAQERAPRNLGIFSGGNPDVSTGGGAMRFHGVNEGCFRMLRCRIRSSFRSVLLSALICVLAPTSFALERLEPPNGCYIGVLMSDGDGI